MYNILNNYLIPDLANVVVNFLGKSKEEYKMEFNKSLNQIKYGVYKIIDFQMTDEIKAEEFDKMRYGMTPMINEGLVVLNSNHQHFQTNKFHMNGHFNRFYRLHYVYTPSGRIDNQSSINNLKKMYLNSFCIIQDKKDKIAKKAIQKLRFCQECKIKTLYSDDKFKEFCINCDYEKYY